MRKWLCMLCALCALALLLWGCARSGAPVSDGTVEDLFIIPATTDVTESELPPLTETAPELRGPQSFGFAGKPELQEDSIGHYASYTGGEMHVPFEINGEGYGVYGVGFLLFLDGIPQPYRMTEDGEIRYFHSLTLPENNKTMQYEFIFTPVTGQAGDMLELYTAFVNWPWYYQTGTSLLDYYSSPGSGAACLRLRFEADPPAAELPVLTEHSFTYEQRCEDLKERDIPPDWTSEDLQEKIEQKFTANGLEFGTALGVGTEEPITLKMEFLGSPAAEYGMVILVDNEPLYVDPERVYTRANSGQKTIIEVKLDMADFTGRRLVYAFLIPRNRWASGATDGSRTFQGSNAIIFAGAATYEELKEE